MTTDKLILDYVYEHEAAQPDRIYLTQPIGGGRVIDYSWAQVLDQSRRMAAHLQSRGLGRGDQIAILSKNCAHFFMAELAIWMAGGTTVAIYPTELAETVRYVLEHSEAKLLFVGKLDTWEQQAPGVPQALPRIAFPLAPPTPYDSAWAQGPGDDRLHLGLDRAAQGGDARLRRSDARRRKHRCDLREGLRPPAGTARAFVPAAGACLRARSD
jgi:acyl-CoA synthetase (AMP-forming)/AMP-acid ligase II